ncbi:MAG TPA: hypothetical protein VL307_08520 [Chitinophagaceae bacterium]|nr:hypothetical protein [Chitinophagaceae bacterium]
MENRPYILAELKEISPLVAAIDVQTPYTVPPGYFEQLSTNILFRLAMEEKMGADPVLNLSKAMPYQVPSGYFDAFAAKMLQTIQQLPATDDADASTSSVLAQAVQQNPYSTPTGYFDALPGNIMSRIRAMETDNAKEELELLSPLLGKLEKKSPLTAPAHYFEDISENIVAGVKAIDFVNDALENLSPVMQELKHTQVYQVPDGYFEQNVAAIMHRVKETKPAGKLVSMSFGSKAMRYAAAAVMTGIVVIAGFLFFNKKDNVQPSLAGTKTTLDSATLAKIPDQEIESFLKGNTVTLADVSDDNTVNENDLKDLLADIPDEELQQYLEQHGAAPNSITN